MKLSDKEIDSLEFQLSWEGSKIVALILRNKVDSGHPKKIPIEKVSKYTLSKVQ